MASSAFFQHPHNPTRPAATDMNKNSLEPLRGREAGGGRGGIEEANGRQGQSFGRAEYI
jgi:hypothetical protein